MPPTILAPLALPAAGEVFVWAWSLEQSTLPETWLCRDELARANRFYSADDRRRFVAAHLGMRGLLGKLLGVDAERLAFQLGEFGKPRIAGHEPNAAPFNLSHSGELALLAVTIGAEIGVDIERHRRVDQADSIARRHFTPGEASSLANLNSNAHQQRFFDLWTGKEAVIKLLGSGLQFPLTQFETPSAVAETGRIALPANNPLRIDGCWLERLTVADGYSAAVATVARPSQVKAGWLDLDALAE